jgi:hypothetical protein
MAFIYGIYLWHLFMAFIYGIYGSDYGSGNFICIANDEPLSCRHWACGGTFFTGAT